MPRWIRSTGWPNELPDGAVLSGPQRTPGVAGDRLDGEHYKDDVSCGCCSSAAIELPATQQIALALRIVCGLSVKQIAQAFPEWAEAAMEQLR